MSEKTPEQLQMEENARIQNEMWLRAEKSKCRATALRTAEGFRCLDANQTIREANILYEWLIKELV